MSIAAGSGSDSGGATTTPPATTNTTKTCKGVKVWDATKKRCVNPQGSSLDQDTLYGAVRELAYAGRYDDAQGVLRVMADQDDDRVLTYWGFTYRKMGKSDMARAYYHRALERNPDNILARSYMGQGFVQDGDTAAAKAQLAEIRARGGAGTWAEASLAEAIALGRTFNY
jgi:tetratricopeptide (TPR) repeat protein